MKTMPQNYSTLVVLPQITYKKISRKLFKEIKLGKYKQKGEQDTKKRPLQN